MKRRVIILILTLSIIASLFTGCVASKEKSATDTSKSEAGTTVEGTSKGVDKETTKKGPEVPSYMNATGYPITKEPIKLKAMVAFNPVNQPESFNENPVAERMAEITNITIDYEQVTIDTLNERKTTAMMSGDLPDLMIVQLTPQEEGLYGPDAFVPLENLIDQYNPNLKRLMTEDKGIKGGITNTDGSIYAYPYIYRLQNNEAAPFINKRWMDNLGLKTPNTIDDFYEVIKAFRTKDPNGNQQEDEIPYGGSSFHEILLSACGIPGNYTQFSIPEDGANKVVWSPAHPNAKEYIQWARKMYAEGVVGEEIFSYPTEKFKEDLANDIVGGFRSFLHIYVPVSDELTDEEVEALSKEWEALPVLTSSVNSKKQWKSPRYLYTGKLAISKKCKYPEAVARWADLLYLPYDKAIQGVSGITMRYGIQGEHWEFEDDTHKYMVSLPEKTTIGGIGQFPCYADVTAPYAGRQGIMKRRHIDEIERAIAPYWVQPFPALRNTSEELEVINNFEKEMKTYSNGMIGKFVRGEEPLENWDAYIATLKQMGLDEITAAYQAAYDRYLEGSK